MKATFWLVDSNNLSGLILDLNMMIVQFFLIFGAVIKRTFSQSNFWTRWNSTYRCMTINLHLWYRGYVYFFEAFNCPRLAIPPVIAGLKYCRFTSHQPLISYTNIMRNKNLGTQLTWLKSSIFLYFLFYCRW